MKFILATSLSAFLIFSGVSSHLDAVYHSNEALHQYMRNYTQRFPKIAQLYSIGTSVFGLELLVLKVTTTQDSMAPNVKFVGNIHGNEAITREVLLQLLEFIGTNQSSDPTVQRLLSSIILHILPSANPDGFSREQIGMCEGTAGRNNANDVDLNRNFPDFFSNIPVVEEAETKAIRRWLESTTFSLSAALHSGTLVANYPFDSPKVQESSTSTAESLAPDDDVLKHLALTYAKSHPSMHLGKPCNGNLDFENGITNGAKWNSFRGGMGDYNYAFAGIMEVTLEISCCKYPMTEEIESIFDENKAALLAFAAQAQRGIRGMIVDYDVHVNPKEIALKIEGRDIQFYPNKFGQFWRILLPGSYNLMIMFNSTVHKTVPFQVNSSTVTRLNVELFSTGSSTESSGSTSDISTRSTPEKISIIASQGTTVITDKSTSSNSLIPTGAVPRARSKGMKNRILPHLLLTSLLILRL